MAWDAVLDFHPSIFDAEIQPSSGVRSENFIELDLVFRVRRGKRMAREARWLEGRHVSFLRLPNDPARLAACGPEVAINSVRSAIALIRGPCAGWVLWRGPPLRTLISRQLSRAWMAGRRADPYDARRSRDSSSRKVLESRNAGDRQN